MEIVWFAHRKKKKPNAELVPRSSTNIPDANDGRKSSASPNKSTFNNMLLLYS